VSEQSYSWLKVYQDAQEHRHLASWKHDVAVAEKMFFTRGQELALSASAAADAELQSLCVAAKNLSQMREGKLESGVAVADPPEPKVFRPSALGIDLDGDVPLIARRPAPAEAVEPLETVHPEGKAPHEGLNKDAAVFRASVARRFWRSS
jgi:hypothetical protein